MGAPAKPSMSGSPSMSLAIASFTPYHVTNILTWSQVVTGALRLVTNLEFYARLKHIDVQHYYVRELLENGTISVDYIRTLEMAIDCLTKPLKKL
jgi:hypothetical protein